MTSPLQVTKNGAQVVLPKSAIRGRDLKQWTLSRQLRELVTHCRRYSGRLPSTCTAFIADSGVATRTVTVNQDDMIALAQCSGAPSPHSGEQWLDAHLTRQLAVPFCDQTA
jgi:hypothetical protein